MRRALPGERASAEHGPGRDGGDGGVAGGAPAAEPSSPARATAAPPTSTTAWRTPAARESAHHGPLQRRRPAARTRRPGGTGAGRRAPRRRRTPSRPVPIARPSRPDDHARAGDVVAAYPSSGTPRPTSTSAIRAHPFLTGLTDGTLPHAAFGHFVVQDAHYLRGYARALAVLAARAPTEDDTTMFARHAAGAIAAEQDMHAELAGPSGARRRDRRRRSPHHARLHQLPARDGHGGSFAEGLGAVLPCYWIYARVGEALLAESSPDPLYARWIAMYGGDEFQARGRRGARGDRPRSRTTSGPAERARVRRALPRRPRATSGCSGTRPGAGSAGRSEHATAGPRGGPAVGTVGGIRPRRDRAAGLALPVRWA